MVDTHAVECTLVPNTKCKCSLWKHFSLQKRKTAELMLMLLCHINSAIPWSNLWEAPQTCQCTWSATISYCCWDHLWGTNKRPTCLSASVSTLVWTEILAHVPVHILYRYAAVAGVYLAAEFTETHTGRSSRDIHDHSKHCHPSHSN